MMLSINRKDNMLQYVLISYDKKKKLKSKKNAQLIELTILKKTL